MPTIAQNRVYMYDVRNVQWMDEQRLKLINNQLQVYMYVCVFSAVMVFTMAYSIKYWNHWVHCRVALLLPMCHSLPQKSGYWLYNAVGLSNNYWWWL